MGRDVSKRISGRQPKGFNIVEIGIVISMIGIMAGIAVPGVLGSIQRRGVDGASRRLAQDVRLAQSHAISRGGQTRLIAFDDSGVAQIPGGTNVTDTTKANQYRIEIRYSPAAAWPALGDTPGSNANVLTPWQDLRSLYGYVAITSANALVFSTLGGLANSTSALTIVLQGTGGTKTVQTNVIGKATIL